MKVKEFFGKFASAYLWGNLLAMLIVIVLLALGVKYGLDWYTHHGEGVKIPKIEGMDYAKARSLIEDHGLNIMVSDSGYNKAMAANSILVQNPGAGTMVKLGHTIYVTVNSPSSPSFAIPDIIDNPLTLMIGSGEYDSDEEIDYIEPEYRMMESGDASELEEVVE